jgi:cysteine desulfurase
MNATPRIYFDNAATTVLAPEVLDAMMPYLTEKFGNPSSIYSYGRETRMAVESARKTIAKILNAHPAEIFFTSGGTESSNTAIHAAVEDLGCSHIISSPIEHHAVLHTIEHFQKKKNVSVSHVKLLDNGHVDLEDLEKQLAASNKKTLLSLMHANNEIGNMLDIQVVGVLCKKYGAIFHSDTVQTVGHFPFDLQNIHVHFITGSAHKFHGPKGVGIVYINEKIKVSPLIHGGAQERNMRAGTENVYGIVGFARALEFATANQETETAFIKNIKLYMMQQLMKNIPGVMFNGDAYTKSLYTVLNVSFPKTKNSEMLLVELDSKGICVSGGSACTTGEASHVISAINTNDDRIPVRFSFSKYNSLAEVDFVVGKLSQFVQISHQLSPKQ